jgi:alpha-beta hydrolase superfamily lysophospholipase
MEKVLYFAHGKESGPVGSKIIALSQVARTFGYRIESPSYEGMDDPAERVEKLLTLQPTGKPLVLVGSSMGAYISTLSSKVLKPDGLFLMAPAFYIKNYKEQNPGPVARYTEIVHGWMDELIPPKAIFDYAQGYQVPLHLVASDHRLNSAIPEITEIFRNFLNKIEGMVNNEARK